MQTTTEGLPDGLNYMAVVHGPIVLAAKMDTSNLKGIYADDSRMGHAARGRQYPLQEMPLFVSNSNNIADQIVPVPGKALTYTAKNIIYPATYQSLELVPFYKIHEARYVIYWQRETPESLKAIQQKMAEQEAAAAKLTAITIDVVNAGEQQPESDHFMERENSNTGVNKDKHWRDARGWFSYKMVDKERSAGRLRVTYFGRDADLRFSILVNDQKMADVVLSGDKGDDFYTVDYPIPENILQANKGELTVKFLAVNGSVAGGVYEVRLLKK
jgi:hypothetical protein